MLIYRVTRLSKEKSEDLARAIINWREFGESELTGFFSEDFYKNLEFPYEPKNQAFELIDELLLVKGMDEPLLNQLQPYLTVYGDGRLNINTASRPALMSVGLDGKLVDKILAMRRGPDLTESTLDDNIYHSVEQLINDISQLNEIFDSKESRQLGGILSKGNIKANSDYYTIVSYGHIMPSGTQGSATCIYDTDQKKIVYWREDY